MPIVPPLNKGFIGDLDLSKHNEEQKEPENTFYGDKPNNFTASFTKNELSGLSVEPPVDKKEFTLEELEVSQLRNDIEDEVTEDDPEDIQRSHLDQNYFKSEQPTRSLQMRHLD